MKNLPEKDEAAEAVSISLRISLNKAGSMYPLGTGMDFTQSFAIRAPNFAMSVKIMERFRNLLETIAGEFPPPPETEDEKRLRKGINF